MVFTIGCSSRAVIIDSLTTYNRFGKRLLKTDSRLKQLYICLDLRFYLDFLVLVFDWI